MLVLGPCLDILAWNRVASALLIDFARVPENERNYVRLVFTDPAVRSRFADWEAVAHMCVAFLRHQAAKDPDEPNLLALVADLSANPSFREWWTDAMSSARQAAPRCSITRSRVS